MLKVNYLLWLIFFFFLLYIQKKKMQTSWTYVLGKN